MRVRTILVPLGAVLALAGCSAGGERSDTSAAAPAAAPVQGNQLAGPEGAVTEAKAPDLSVGQRSIVYTGSISVRLKAEQRVDEVAARAAAVATGAGGFVSSDKRSSGTGHGEATMELRVPAERFAAVVDQLAALGAKTEDRTVNTRDVTEETLDLDARIKTQQARVDSGRTLLAQAKSLSDLVMLEGELAKREADLASLQSKKQHLADLTALSTITVVLLDAQAAAAAPPGGFLGGLAAGWAALVASLKVLLTVLGALLPWLVALAGPAYALWWLLRRRRRGVPAVPVAAPSAAE
jgi:hypothetical protein